MDKPSFAVFSGYTALAVSAGVMLGLALPIAIPVILPDAYHNLISRNKVPVESPRTPVANSTHAKETPTQNNPFAPAADRNNDKVLADIKPSAGNTDISNTETSVGHNLSDQPARSPVTDTSRITHYRDLASSLLWLDSASPEEIQVVVDDTLNKSAEALFSRESNSSYTYVWIQSLINRWLELDSENALRFLLKNDGAKNRNETHYMLQSVVQEQLQTLVNTDPRKLSHLLAQLDPNEFSDPHLLLQLQMQIDPEATLAKFKDVENLELKFSAINGYLQQLAVTQPQQALEWMESNSELSAELEHSMKSSIFFQWAETDPQGMLNFIETAPAEQVPSGVLFGAYLALGRTHPEGALSLVKDLSPQEAQSAKMSILSDWSQSDSNAAASWLLQAVNNGDINTAEIEPYVLSNMPVESTLSIIDQMPNEQSDMALFAISQQLQANGPEAFALSVDSLPTNYATRIRSMLEINTLAETDPVNALDQLATFSTQLQGMFLPYVVVQAERNSPGAVADWVSVNNVDDSLKSQIDYMLKQNSTDPTFLPPYYESFLIQGINRAGYSRETFQNR